MPLQARGALTAQDMKQFMSRVHSAIRASQLACTRVGVRELAACGSNSSLPSWPGNTFARVLAFAGSPHAVRIPRSPPCPCRTRMRFPLLTHESKWATTGVTLLLLMRRRHSHSARDAAWMLDFRRLGFSGCPQCCPRLTGTSDGGEPFDGVRKSPDQIDQQGGLGVRLRAALLPVFKRADVRAQVGRE